MFDDQKRDEPYFDANYIDIMYSQVIECGYYDVVLRNMQSIPDNQADTSVAVKYEGNYEFNSQGVLMT